MKLPIARHRRRGHGRSSVLWHGRVRLHGPHYVDLDLHLGWLLTMLVMTWLLGQSFLPSLFPHWPHIAYWGVAALVVLIDCIAGLLHELGHAMAAIGKGRRVYRITLYGLVASVRRSNHHLQPRDQIAIAVAGPISHLLVGALLWTTWQFLPVDNEPLRVATAFPAVSNLAAGVFNLLPVHPLDGARVARALIATVFRA